ncbi:hypothetical protein N657DRAFT_657714 [Parathielavia appendiculata]|uniref:Uncharacterized protein n=1 Tax=Parathielavia appendiculata TaxID=2587402 RepID=A0AAN6TWX0_9PEZI|nr:hypothetical protein N657DRAFT_657714 [Parathielavia appendiculata]
MPPIATHPSDLYGLYEAFNTNTHEFLYTTFSAVDDDDVFYFGQLNVPQLKITPEQFTAALERIPDQDIFPQLLSDARLTIAPDELDTDAFYIKRARLGAYEEHRKDNTLSTIPTLVLDEIHALQIVSEQPHPGIIRYHGRRHSYNLKERLLESAVRHIHSLGLAQNDINPCQHFRQRCPYTGFSGLWFCREIVPKLGAFRGTVGWFEGDMLDYNTSEKSHDWLWVGLQSGKRGPTSYR